MKAMLRACLLGPIHYQGSAPVCVENGYHRYTAHASAAQELPVSMLAEDGYERSKLLGRT